MCSSSPGPKQLQKSYVFSYVCKLCDWELHIEETSLEILFPSLLVKAAMTTIVAEGGGLVEG